MKIDSNITGNTIVVNLFGDVDHHSTDIIKNHIYKNLTPDIKNMIINLEGVEFMDSSGIGMILGRYKEMSEKMGTVSVTGIRGNMERIYTLSGLYRIIKSYDTVDEAIEAVKAQAGVYK